MAKTVNISKSLCTFKAMFVIHEESPKEQVLKFWFVSSKLCCLSLLHLESGAKQWFCWVRLYAHISKGVSKISPCKLRTEKKPTPLKWKCYSLLGHAGILVLRWDLNHRDLDSRAIIALSRGKHFDMMQASALCMLHLRLRLGLYYFPSFFSCDNHVDFTFA